MAGLISTAQNSTNTNPLGDQFLTAGSTTYDPSLTQVNQPTDTVSGQINTLLAQNSPYLQTAQTGAMEMANSRGLLNSSVAAGAGEQAAISAALPIASADANTYSTTRLANQAASNNALEFGAQATNNSNLFNTGQGNQLVGQRLGAQLEAGTIIPAQTGAQAQLMGLQNQYTQQLANLQADLQAGKIMPEQFNEQKALLDQQHQQQIETIQAQTAAQSQLMTQQTASASQLQSQQAAFNYTLQQLRGDQSTQLANIEGQYRGLLQTSASASQFFTNVTTSMGAIMSDVTTSDAQKTAAVTQMQQLLQAGLAVIGSVGNVDLTGLVNFGTV